MLKTTKNMLRLGKAMVVGLAVGQIQRKIATRYRDSKNDPLYHHWYLALDSLIVASRSDFDTATKALLEEMDQTRSNPVKPEASSKRSFKVTKE